jgi:hypothetical protein
VAGTKEWPSRPNRGTDIGSGECEGSVSARAKPDDVMQGPSCAYAAPRMASAVS